MDVTDVLRDRMNAPKGLNWMFGASMAAHLVFVAAFVSRTRRLAPGRAENRHDHLAWRDRTTGRPTAELTSIGGRAVQAVKPPDEPKRPEPVRPPAAKVPEMTVPVPNRAPTKAAPAPKVQQAPDDARGRTPTRGAEARPGSAIAETGARGEGFGLSTGGGQGSGSRLDVGDFCCPDYIITMVERIRANWVQRAEVSGMTVVKFTIQRDGSIANAAVDKTSGYIALDTAALRGVLGTRQLPPLPVAFPNPTLTVYLNFEYKR